jgi:hypothetical protein
MWFSFNQCLNNANMTLEQLTESLQTHAKMDFIVLPPLPFFFP